MKLKFRFLESLWPFQKQFDTLNNSEQNAREITDKRFITYLLILWLIIFLFSILRCNAQERPLKVGDKVPDITFSNVVNYKSATLKLSEFKGQVIMLDFWATWCSSCLAAFPHEYELQKKLPGKFKIILVDCKSTRDKPEKVARFLEERKASYQFTSLSNDTVLEKFFPHPGGLPHFVLIKDNVVVAIPDRRVLTEANIQAAYTNKPLTIAQNKYILYDFNKEVFHDGNGGEPSKPLYHSLLFDFKPYLERFSSLLVDDSNRVSRIDLINRTRVQMICYSLPDADEIGNNRVLLKVSNPDDYSDSESETWNKRNRFIYESTFSPRSRETALTILKDDLQRFFNIRYNIISRDTDCLVLTLLDTVKIPKGIFGVHPESNYFDHRDAPVFFRNTPMTEISFKLENVYKLPVINDTNYRNRISLNLPANLSDIKAVTDSLERQGIKLSKEKRRIRYLLIEDTLPQTASNQ
ncbi:MAG: TlpA family protein disulfide reductase [Mucilaginibacter sp.]